MRTDEDGAVGVLVMAHGTPARIEDLEGFYTEIRRGRPPSSEQLAELESRYLAIGGLSPLNAVTASQADGIAGALQGAQPGGFVVRHGSRFADPRIEDAVKQLADATMRKVVGLVLAPHSSRASVAEYARRAREASEARGMELAMVDHWYDAPGFAELVSRRVGDALSRLPGGGDGACVVFSAHSIPAALVEAGDDYPDQLAESARLVADVEALPRIRVAWQSAGRTPEPWVGPDVREVIAEEADRGTPAVVVCPIGFVSDHLEVLYDIDVDARAVAGKVGVAFTRTASFNDDPELCAVLAGVVRDRARRPVRE